MVGITRMIIKTRPINISLECSVVDKWVFKAGMMNLRKTCQYEHSFDNNKRFVYMIIIHILVDGPWNLIFLFL